MNKLRLLFWLLAVLFIQNSFVHAMTQVVSGRYDDGVDNTHQLLLSIDNKERGLDHLDEQRIERFVRTAISDAEMRWRRPYTIYKLVSQMIFLDERAFICRTYQLEATSLLPFIKPIVCKETACRKLNGRWTRV